MFPQQFQPKGVNEIITFGKSLLKSSAQIFLPSSKEAESELTEQYLNQIIERFANKQMSYDEASQTFTKYFGTSRPIDQIQMIFDEANISQPIALPYSFINSKNAKARHWTKREDTRLLAGVYLFGPKDWNHIALFVGAGRARPQCLQRWTRTLNPDITKDVWTTEEEERLLKIVSQYEKVSWTKVANMMGNRSDVQCRYHYSQVMKLKENHSSESKPETEEKEKDSKNTQKATKDIKEIKETKEMKEKKKRSVVSLSSESNTSEQPPEIIHLSSSSSAVTSHSLFNIQPVQQPQYQIPVQLAQPIIYPYEQGYPQTLSYITVYQQTQPMGIDAFLSCFAK